MKTSPCLGHPARPDLKPGSFPDEQVRVKPVKISRNGKKRTIVLVLVHLAIFAHILHWQLAGETLAPLEPSEAMYTVATGVVNAGAVLLVLSVLATLVFGRFFCGWACHLVALQDLCAYLLRRIGIRPRPLRSRWLVIVPLLAGIHLFLWPWFVRANIGLPAPTLETDFVKANFWETFPGFWIGALTFAICGFAIIYLLGAKGFCTYACPYGGFFGLADRFAPGRIVVNDDCKRCGHCTAVCTSNVLVHKEVHEYGAVVDPGCMKCMDCVSACPENALSFGFTKPAALRKPRHEVRRAAPQFRYGEELLMALVFAVTMFALRGLPHSLGAVLGLRFIFDGEPSGWSRAVDRFAATTTHLYGVMPSLFALGLSAITAFVFAYALRLLRRKDVHFQGYALKLEGRLSRAGRVFAVFAALWFALFAQSLAHQVLAIRIQSDVEATAPIAAAVWIQDPAVLGSLPADMAERVQRIESSAALAARLGLVESHILARHRVYADIIRRDLNSAAARLERLTERFPRWGNHYSLLGDVHTLAGRYDEAVQRYLQAAERRTEEGTFARAVFDGLQATVQRGQQAHAVGLSEAIVRQGVSEVAAYYLAVQVLTSTSGLQRGFDLLATEALPAAMRAAPPLELRKLKASLLAQAQRHEEAAAAFLEVHRAAPKDFALHLSYVEQLQLAGQRTAARAACEELIAAWPDRPEPLSLQAIIVESMGEAQRAAELRRRAAAVQAALNASASTAPR